MNRPVTPSNPFPGLRPFREDEEYLFFGREAQVDAMIDELATTRFLAVVGTSGSGKSSLVNCGLVPALHRGLLSAAGSGWRLAVMRPGNRPLRALAEALGRPDVLLPPFADASGFTPAEMMEATLGMGKLGIVDAYQQAKLDTRKNLLVVVDQFEELFRYQSLATVSAPAVIEGPARSSEEATAFVNLLLEAVLHPELPIYVVLTMRSDFLGECAQFYGLPEIVNRGQYLVPRMTRDERRAAIAEPLRVSGATLEPVLLTRLVNDVGDDPDQISILQHALNRTWVCWLEDGGKGPLSIAQYERAGTMADALNRHAEEAYALLTEGRQRILAAALFKAITDKVTDARGTRRPTRFDLLCQIEDADAAELAVVIEVFRDPARSFLMPPAGIALRPDTPIDISHETLMRVWSRLRGWADEESQSARTFRGLADIAERHHNGRAALLRQPDLQFATDWVERQKPNAAWAGRYRDGFEETMQFLEASQRAGKEERRRQVAASRRRRTLASALVVALVLVAITLFALNQQATRAKLRAEASRTDAENLVGFLIGEQFLQKLRPVGSNDLLTTVQAQVQKYLDRSAGSSSPSTLRNRALALRNDGDIAIARGHLADGIENYGRSANTFNELAGSSDAAPEDTIEQARALERLADALLDSGRTREALNADVTALGLRQAAADRGAQDLDHRIELASSHISVASVLTHLGRPEEALRQHLEPAQQLLDELRTDAVNTPKWFSVAGQGHVNRGEALAWVGDDAGSDVERKRARDIAKDWSSKRPLAADAREAYVTIISIIDQNPPPEDSVRGATASRGSATVGPSRTSTGAAATNQPQAVQSPDPFLRGETPESVDELKQARSAMQQLEIWDPTNVTWRHDVPAISLILAKKLMASQAFDKTRALDEAQREIDTVAQPFLDLAAIDPSNLSAAGYLGWLFQARAELEMAQSRDGAATEDYRTAQRYYADVAAGSPDDLMAQSSWYWVVYALAQARDRAGDHREAADLLRQGRERVASLLERMPEPRVLPAHLTAFYQAELAALEFIDKSGAGALVEEWHERLAKLVASRPRDSSLAKEVPWADVGAGSEARAAGRPIEGRLADTFDDLKQTGDSETARRAALAAARHAGDLRADAFHANEIYFAQWKLGDTLRKSGRLEEALAQFQGASEWTTKAVQRDPKDPIYAANGAYVFTDIVRVETTLKRRDAALAAYAQATKSGTLAVSLATKPATIAEYANRQNLLEIMVGDLYLSEPAQPAQALAHFRAALAWVERAIRTWPDESVYTGNIAYAQRRIAGVLRTQNDLEGEAAALRKAVEAGERAAAIAAAHEPVAVQAVRQVALSDHHQEMAEYAKRRHDNAAALASDRLALAALEKAVQLEPGQASTFGAMRKLHKKMADQRKAGDDADGELAELRAGADAAQKAVALDASSGNRDQAAQAVFDLGDHYQEANEPRKALEAYRSAADQEAQAVLLDPKNAEMHRGVSVCQRKMGEIQSMLHDAAAAMESFDVAIRSANRAVELGPDDDYNTWSLYQAQWSKARHVDAQGDVRTALALYGSALQNAQHAAQHSSAEKIYRNDVEQLQREIAAHPR